MENERDAEDAIRRLDRTEFGRKGRRLRVEWTKVMYLIVVGIVNFFYHSVLLFVLISIVLKLFYICMAA